ncbi:hypothetical protein L6164_009304 [Bauhinia variegata]|uniref:Uncharacterized protein n=1 Tax=Bauhinia variegata TaxID=167791 RepID=A0ACB9PJF2_BAUVA|nr:hypothetical protein L6164_009304 [Bauhinia variegata]
MWALRRASVPLRSRGFSMGTSRGACVNLREITCAEDKAGFSESFQRTYDRLLLSNTFYHTGHASLKFSVKKRELSSQADASSIKEEVDLEDGFSELERPAADKDENDDEELELSDDGEDVEEPQNELELSETEIDSAEKKSRETGARSELFKAMLKSTGLSVNDVLDKWVEEGKDLSSSEVSSTMANLRRRRMYGSALQLSEWLEAKEQIDFVEKDYASRLDLLAKMHGLHKAENYIGSIPNSFRGEIIYRTLLANCVRKNKAKKAEEIFNKMRDLEFPLTTFACDQLLLLYKRTNKKKIADVLLLMKKENVKPSLFTYRLLIDAKGGSNDIAGMDQIVDSMKAEGVEPDFQIQGILAKHYASAGLTQKAEAVLTEMEGRSLKGGKLKEHLWVCRSLLCSYAELGNADEVGRIWKVCESNPGIDLSVAAIEAWGKLKKIEEAEAAFEQVLNELNKPSSRPYIALLKVYANNKMLNKGKDLIKRMADSEGRIGPLILNPLVQLYVQSGEVERADAMLQKAVQQNKVRPLFSTYMTIMDEYAKRGDIHNSEKIFHRMRLAGYTSRFTQFQALVQTYVNAKVPAYGIRERIKADNVFPNKALAGQLALVDAFRKTRVSDILD